MDFLVRDFQRGVTAFSTLEASRNFFLLVGCRSFTSDSGEQKNAGRVLSHHSGPLKNGIKACQEARRDNSFQQTDPEMGNG
jgi:hypothetical protein